MKGKQQPHKPSPHSAVEDERFKEVYTDPRFMKVPQKLKKVEIDDRFKKALNSKEFNLIQKVDKYGHKVNKQDNTMKAFYNMEQQEDDNVKAKRPNRYYDDDGKFKWEAQSSSEEELDEESDMDDLGQGRNVHVEGDQASDEDSKSEGVYTDNVDVGKRLALTNMDWDNMNAVDILAIFNSLCKGDMVVLKVDIYPSLYGIEQMKKDTLYGPPKELFEKVKSKKKEEEFEEEEDLHVKDLYDQDQLRKYEKNKMRYFYAVIHCNSTQTAEKIYSEYNNYDFELSNISLALSFISDELVFPQQLKESAS